jgi:hypothetical protein
MNDQDRSPQHTKLHIRHGFLILSAFQLFAIGFGAFIIGAIVPVFVRYQKQQSPQAPNGIIAPITSRQVFNNFLRQSNRTKEKEKKLAWREYLRKEGHVSQRSCYSHSCFYFVFSRLNL